MELQLHGSEARVGNEVWSEAWDP